MKIVILSNQARSMSNFWSVLIRRMLAAGHTVICAAPPGDAAAEAALRALGAEVVNYPLDRKGLNPVRDAESFFALLRLFRAKRPDLLFATTIKPVIYGCLAARVAGVPRVYATITGLGYAFEADSLFKKCVNRLGVLLYRLALGHVSGVFFQNEDDLGVFRQQGILAPDARVLMARGGTGVDTARFAPAPCPPLPPEGPVIFLLVGRLLEAKGLHEYAEAGRRLKARGANCRLHLLGPEETGLGGVPLAQIRRWQAEGFVEYLGETRDVRPFIAASHVMVLPSWREGTPTSVMEALSMARPAIVTDVPGCREVVREGVNGWLTPPRDPEALARAMERFVADPALIARMGAAGRKLALAEFDAETVAARILKDMGVPEAARDDREEQP
ncbi:MAG: glycosyltransferase family 4 protein [Desulfovibrio sp.]|uniref:glycosyltransferase family 4 protein n=1 Tax=Desulfovibrio sp. TaxID=885 RepID=UPI001A6C49C1|nr:glycosyltransferase family 4 protein [Desulfovibrio sp.]MBD5416235.1 glycosyltransferase family 4 protein [Desulfovibrio sp.]